jgi:hypothetical protein
MAEVTEAQLRAAAQAMEQKEQVEALVKASVGMLLEQFKIAEAQVQIAGAWAGHQKGSLAQASMVIAWQALAAHVGAISFDRAMSGSGIPRDVVETIRAAVVASVKTTPVQERPAILWAAR